MENTQQLPVGEAYQQDERRENSSQPLINEENKLNEKNCLLPSDNKIDLSQTFVTGKECSQLSNNEEVSLQEYDSGENCGQSSVSEEETSQSSVIEEDCSQKPVNEKDILQPSSNEEENLHPSDIEDYSQSSVSEEHYSENSTTVKENSYSSMGEEKDFLQLSAIGEDYSQPSITKTKCLQSSAAKDDYTSISKVADMKKEMQADQKTSVMITDLPDEILKRIFKFLSFNDLLTVRKVCTTFNNATMDTMVWRHSPLCLNGTLSELTSVPYLHTVTVSISNGDELLDALMNNILDLRKMHVLFLGNLSEEKFKNFIEKFKNFEIISLYFSYRNNPAFLKLIDILKTCSNLKGLCLGNITSDVLSCICRAIGDGLPGLKKLYILDVYNHRDDNNALSELLKRKINQLTHLGVSYSDVHPKVFELIFLSTSLEKFVFTLCEMPQILLDLSRMVNLKSLSIFTENDIAHKSSSSGIDCLVVNQKIIFPQSIEFLEISLHPNITFPGIIDIPDNSLPHLRVLKASGIADPDLDIQLQKISNLPDIQCVYLDECISLSAKGIEHIMKCRKLQKLYVSDVAFTDSTYKCLEDCKYLCKLKLENCTLDPETLISAISKLEYLTKLCVYYCGQKNEEGEFVPFDDKSVMDHLIQQYRCDKYHVKIRFGMYHNKQSGFEQSKI